MKLIYYENMNKFQWNYKTIYRKTFSFIKRNFSSDGKLFLKRYITDLGKNRLNVTKNFFFLFNMKAGLKCIINFYYGKTPFRKS